MWRVSSLTLNNASCKLRPCLPITLEQIRSLTVHAVAHLEESDLLQITLLVPRLVIKQKLQSLTFSLSNGLWLNMTTVKYQYVIIGFYFDIIFFDHYVSNHYHYMYHYVIRYGGIYLPRWYFIRHVGISGCALTCGACYSHASHARPMLGSRVRRAFQFKKSGPQCQSIDHRSLFHTFCGLSRSRM